MLARRNPQKPQAPQTPLILGNIPAHLRLQRGQVLSCTRGCLWITSDALAGRGYDSDVVLERGQSFATPQAAIYFVSAPLGHGVLSLLSPGAMAGHSVERTC